MRRVTLILVSVVVLIVLTFIGLHIAWRLKSPKTLNIYILDKSVTHTDRPEHKSLIWALNYLRIVGPDGRPYNHLTDYWGFFPIDVKQQLFDIKTIRLNEIDAYAAVYDAAYYADCYGVYSYEWYKSNTPAANASKIYGGLNQNDYLFLKRMKELNKLIIGEYNMFSSPTNALIRSKTEEIFNLTWTGWSGKFFSNLNPETGYGIADWMVKLYEQQHLKPWPKQGSGIILLSNDGLIEILTEETDLKSTKVKLLAGETMKNWPVAPKDVSYTGWFDIVAPRIDAEVMAKFRLDVTPRGEEKLKALGLNTEFPAIVKAKPDKPVYYLAGDFSDNPVNLFCSKLTGGKMLNEWLVNQNDKGDFFNNFYIPLINQLINSYQATGN